MTPIALSQTTEETAAANPFGIHGPTYSHWLAAKRPNLWREGDILLTTLRGTGAGWARQDFWWSLVEPQPGRFVWDDSDRAVESYDRHGIKLLAILCYASAWSEGVSPQTDTDREQFAGYVFEMVTRYKGRIAAFEIWNEPNIQPFWSPRPDPKLYTELLKAAYAAAKHADPACVIVGGAMAGPDDKFLRGMYEAGARGSFDVLSYHNYGQQMEIESEWPAVERMRAVMAEFGDADKSIWQTENGFYTGPAGLSEPEQAARIVRYSVGLLALGIERTFQLTLADWTDNPKNSDLSVYRGLTHADFSPKPSCAAYRTMSERLADKRFVATLRPAEGLSAYLFRNARESVLVLWRAAAPEPKPVVLDLGVPVALTQTLGGDWRRLESVDGQYEISIGSDPIYVLNPGESISNQRYVQWPNPIVTRIGRVRDAVVEVPCTNPGDEPAVLRLYPHRVASMRFESAEIPAGATRSTKIAVNALSMGVGTHEFFWSLDVPGRDTPIAGGYRRFEIESPFELAFAPLTQLSESTPRLPVEVRCAGGAGTTATFQLQQNGQNPKSVDAALKGDETTVVELPLDVASLRKGNAAPLKVTMHCDGLNLDLETQRRLIPCPRAPQDAAIDGSLAEWSELPPQIEPAMLRWEYVNPDAPPSAEDLTVTVWLAHDARGIWLAARVQDDVLTPPQSRDVWNWDSLQVALDLRSDAEPGQGFDDDDLEIELGGGDGEAWCYLGASPAGWPADELSTRLRSAVNVDRDHHTVTYELLIPADLIASVRRLAPDAVFGFSLLVNDNDGQGRAGWLELTPGIGLGKRPDQFAWLWLR